MAALDRLLTQVAQGPLARRELESVRREILEDALQFFERLLEKNGDDPTLRYETAWAHLRVSQIRHALGQGMQASEEARQAIELLERLVTESPERTSYRYSLALGAVAMANIETDAHQAAAFLLRAVDIGEQLSAEAPTQFEYRVLLAGAFAGLGYLYGNEGRISDAERAYERALSNYRQLDGLMGPDRVWHDKEAQVQNSLGLLLRTAGRYAEAERAHRRSLELLGATSRFQAGDGTTETARSNFHLGLALWRLKRDDQAESAIREALALRERLLAGSPGSRFDRGELALTRQTLSVMLEQTGRLPEAEKARRLACDELSSLSAEFPAVTEYRDLAGRAQVYMGHLLWNAERFVDARQYYRAGTELLERDRTAPSGGWILTGDAGFLIATYPEAELIDAEKVLRSAKQAVEASPDRSWSRTALGAAYYRSGDFPAAAAALIDSLSLEPRESAAPALFLAMTYAQQGKSDLARRSLADAVRRIDEERPLDPALLRLRKEAEALLAQSNPPGDRQCPSPTTTE